MKRNLTKIAVIPLITISIFSLVVVGYFIYVKNTYAKDNNYDRSLVLINKIRSKNGVGDLNWNKNLANAASDKVNDIISKKYFQHTSPLGVKAWDLILKNDYSYVYAGENLAIDYGSVDEAIKAWVESPSHFKNIISDKYKEYGFAQGEGDVEGHVAKIYVQIFATRENAVKQFLTFSEIY